VIATLRRASLFLTPAERKHWAGLVPLAFATAFFETAGAALVFALIRIASEPQPRETMPLLAPILAVLPWREPRELVLFFTAAVAAFFTARSLCLVAVASLEAKVLSGAKAGIAARLLDRYVAAPYTFHLGRNSAELVHNLVTAVEQTVQCALAASVYLVTEGLVALGLIVLLMVTAPLVTFVTALALSLLIGVSLRITNRRLAQAGALENEAARSALLDIQRCLGGLKEIRVLGRERYFLDRFREHLGALSRARRRRTTTAALPRLIVETAFVGAVLIVVALVTLGGKAGPDVLALIGLYAYAGFRLIPCANRAVMYIGSIRHAAAFVGRLAEDFHALENAAKPPEAREKEPIRFLDRIAIERVSYAYEGNRAPVLQGVSIEIRRGESIGIVGATGAGKSTLIDLLLGLVVPTEGRIAVDGRDIHEALSSWQRKIGYVPQSVFLIDDTVRRNVALGVPDAEIDERRLSLAVRLARLDEFLSSLPQGLDTLVGERGVRLSGGQRQRVAIARALYHEPEVLIFDEATSALDNQTEREVTRAIGALQREKTLIIIAHRLSTVRGCDRLFFLREGRVAAVGSFDELLEKNEAFRAMAEAGKAE
jgi:ATP-binding cassette subfamily C protein